MRENPNPNIQTGSWSRGRIIITLFTSFLLFLIFKNILTKDYKNETKNYLTKIGREDAIERVIPKTTTDLINENKLKQLRYEQLILNVTKLQETVKELQVEVNELKSKDSNNNNNNNKSRRKLRIGR